MKFAFQSLEIETDFQNQLRYSLAESERMSGGKESAQIRQFTLPSLDNPDVVESIRAENPREWCPVGTIEFCEKWFTDICGLPYCKPRNLPECLFIYRGGAESPSNRLREYLATKDKGYIDLVSGVECFVKSNETIKHPANGVYTVSDIISENSVWRGHDIQTTTMEYDIDSEWRAFVFHGNIVDVRPYAGDSCIAPSRDDIQMFVDEIQATGDDIPSYTLDVFVTKYGKTKPLEMHDFFSCGLYGFQSHLYPAMLTQWFFYYKNKLGNQS